jgi:uncharacterized protein (DUF342 family)
MESLAFFMERIYNQPKDALKRQTSLFGGLSDGNISISFSNSNLEAYADFTPAIGSGHPMSINEIAEILGKINVIHGIHWDTIKYALEVCNSTRREVRDILIAQGDAPESEITEYFELAPALARTNQQINKKTRIDYRERSPFTIVKKGQTLAEFKPRKLGKEGVNIYGVYLPFNIVQSEGVVGGGNTRTENDRIVAEIHGQFINTNGLLSVQEKLIIKGAVGYSTGNIIFPGDVFIQGPVSDGFKIYSGGTLVIKQTLDLTKVIAKENVIVSGGIIGKGSALIKSGGGIKTKFIENCNAAAQKSVLVESEIINSSVYSLGSIEMSEQGLILGGNIYAVHCLRAGGIGRKGGKPTRIHCGVDFTALQEKEKCNKQLYVISEKMAKLRVHLENPLPDAEMFSKIEEMYRKLEEEQVAVSTRIFDLMGKICVDENAVVEVSGEIAVGTLIEICQIAFCVEEPLRRTRVRLDKILRKLVCEPL